MSKQTASIAASLVLIGLTVAVFATLRDYGPEATVRRFHRAAVTNNMSQVERFSDHKKGSDSAVVLAKFVSNTLARGANIRVRRVDRSQSSRVVAEFLYILPGQVEVLYWVVKRSPKGWVVATDEMVSRQFSPPVGFNSPQ